MNVETNNFTNLPADGTTQAPKTEDKTDFCKHRFVHNLDSYIKSPTATKPDSLKSNIINISPTQLRGLQKWITIYCK